MLASLWRWLVPVRETLPRQVIVRRVTVVSVQGNSYPLRVLVRVEKGKK